MKKKSFLSSAKRLISRIYEAEAYFYRYTRRDCPDRTRVLIFAQGRTGSTLLENLICSTGHFCEGGELLNTTWKGEVFFPLQYVRGMARRKAEENFIFHLKIYHLTDDRRRSIEPTWFVRTLFEEGWKVIYLTRKNKLKHALSNMVAKSRQNYHKLDDNEETLQLTVNCEKLVKRVRKRFQYEQLEREALSYVRYLEISYEDDLESSEAHQKTVKQVLDYLSLERREASTKYKKVNTQTLRELIANYDEFLSCVYQHGWQDFL